MPDQANRIVARTEMPHVGVKCLGPGHSDKNATQNEKTRIAVREQITQTIKRVQGRKRIPEAALQKLRRYASVVSRNYGIITSVAASASLARRIFSRIFTPEARQTYFFGFWLRSAR
jgi:hypothetical protein